MNARVQDLQKLNDAAELHLLHRRANTPAVFGLIFGLLFFGLGLIFWGRPGYLAFLVIAFLMSAFTFLSTIYLWLAPKRNRMSLAAVVYFAMAAGFVLFGYGDYLSGKGWLFTTARVMTGLVWFVPAQRAWKSRERYQELQETVDTEAVAAAEREIKSMRNGKDEDLTFVAPDGFLEDRSWRLRLDRARATALQTFGFGVPQRALWIPRDTMRVERTGTTLFGRIRANVHLGDVMLRAKFQRKQFEKLERELARS